MNTINEARESIIVEITPKWELVPNKYKKLNFSKSQIISHICEKYIEIVAKIEEIPMIFIKQGELEEKDFKKVVNYAIKMGVIVIYTKDLIKERKIIRLMEILNKYSYAEEKWSFIARKVLKREIAKTKK